MSEQPHSPGNFNEPAERGAEVDRELQESISHSLSTIIDYVIETQLTSGSDLELHKNNGNPLRLTITIPSNTIDGGIKEAEPGSVDINYKVNDSHHYIIDANIRSSSDGPVPMNIDLFKETTADGELTQVYGEKREFDLSVINTAKGVNLKELAFELLDTIDYLT